MLENLMAEIERVYPNGIFSVKKGVGIGKKEKKEKGGYEAYICTDLEIGTPSHLFSIDLGFSPFSALHNAFESVKAKEQAFKEAQRMKK